MKILLVARMGKASKAFGDFIDSTTVHGLVYIFKAEKVLDRFRYLKKSIHI